MNKKRNRKSGSLQIIFRIVQGALIGLGAVLPGISGGVLSVIFGIYKPIMELLSNPFKNFKTHVPKLRSHRRHRISRSSQYSLLLPGEISGSVRLRVHRTDHRNASVTVP